MKRLIVILALVGALFLGGCQSNRSLLIDNGLEIGLDIPIIPIPLPKVKLGFKLHFRKPTIREEIELNLSKLGKQLEEHNQVPRDKLDLESAPAPFSAREEKENEEGNVDGS
jgi:hypothetical protein